MKLPFKLVNNQMTKDATLDIFWLNLFSGFNNINDNPNLGTLQESWSTFY